MQRLTGGLLYLIGGALAGVASAYAMIHSAGVTRLGGEGPWFSRTAGQDGIYAQSYFLLAGRLPAAPGQLTEAMAERDSAGQPLSASCSYVLLSSVALPQWWSLSTLSSGTNTPSRQMAVHALSAVREADGSLRVAAAATPQPGNWLKLSGGRTFTFLYLATPAAGRSGERPPPWRIERREC